MIEISINELYDVNKYESEFSSIYFTSVLKGMASGIVWGNDKYDPSFLLVWSSYQEGFQLMGKPLEKNEWNDFRRWFDQIIIPFMREQEIECFEYGVDTEELGVMFQNIFEDYTIESSYQKIFQWVGPIAELDKPVGYEVKKVDRLFLQQDYLNKESIFDELKRAYGDMELYYKYGLAYTAIYNNTVVSRAYMLFFDDLYGNISVDTDNAYQKKGLSSYLTMKLIEDGQSLGIAPIWDCTEENVASERTANKCGFQKVRMDKIYCFEVRM